MVPINKIQLNMKFKLVIKYSHLIPEDTITPKLRNQPHSQAGKHGDAVYYILYYCFIYGYLL